MIKYYELRSGHRVHKLHNPRSKKTLCGLTVKIPPSPEGDIFDRPGIKRRCQKCWGGYSSEFLEEDSEN